MQRKIFGTIIGLIILIIIVMILPNSNNLPLVAIANYGPHASLEATINGFKLQMKQRGFIENQNIRYVIADVGFDAALIPQMITSLYQQKPKVMVVITTPVAQFSKAKIHDIPLVYAAITDPAEAGLLGSTNMTGSSDKQDLENFIIFAKSLLPNSKSIGLLYTSSESNDIALVKMMQAAVLKFNMQLIAIPVEQSSDIPIRMQKFKNKVDFIYVGTSGIIQPALPTIAAEAQKMHIPVFNVEDQAARNGLVLASFGVNYQAVGSNAGKLVAALLDGQKVSDLEPIYPGLSEHHGVIYKKKATELGIIIPDHIEAVE